MAAMSDDDRFAFLAGAWVPVDSSWITEARYDLESETLEIAVKGSGGPHSYSPVTFTQAEGFSYAPSQGQWMWQVLFRAGIYAQK